MDRRFTEFVAQNGPLFKKPKRIDRLNLEDTTLSTHKWTTKICNGELEALPIIVERDETEQPDGEPVPAESSEIVLETMSALVEVVATPSMNETGDLPIDSLTSSASTADLSCIFTNTALSVHSFRESEFETMYNNAVFASDNPKTNRNLTNDSMDSSSDEEIDNYFKFRITLPTRKFGRTNNLQTTEARTELIGEPQSSPPTTSQTEELAEMEAVQETITASQCEVVVATMEADFSDTCSEENVSLSRRISQPLSLRYSSEEVEDTVKVLSHTTSFMNFVSDQVRGMVEEVPILDVDDTMATSEKIPASAESDQEGKLHCEGERRKFESSIQVVENLEQEGVGLELQSGYSSCTTSAQSENLKPLKKKGSQEKS